MVCFGPPRRYGLQILSTGGFYCSVPLNCFNKNPTALFCLLQKPCYIQLITKSLRKNFGRRSLFMTVIEPAEIFLARSWQVNAGLVKYLLVKVRPTIIRGVHLTRPKPWPISKEFFKPGQQYLMASGSMEKMQLKLLHKKIF